MQNDDFQKKVIATLNHTAKNHMQKHTVMENVFAKIEQDTHVKFNRWGLTGFALAAAISGIVIMPSTFFSDASTDTQATVNTVRLSPQLAEDLEMLLVLGEDMTHGS